MMVDDYHLLTFPIKHEVQGVKNSLPSNCSQITPDSAEIHYGANRSKAVNSLINDFNNMVAKKELKQFAEYVPLLPNEITLKYSIFDYADQPTKLWLSGYSDISPYVFVPFIKENSKLEPLTMEKWKLIFYEEILVFTNPLRGKSFKEIEFPIISIHIPKEISEIIATYFGI